MARAAQSESEWAEVAWSWVRALVPGEVFTSEDMTDDIGLPRVVIGTNRNNAVGAVVNAAANAGIITRVGYVNSRRPSSHAAAVALWERV